MPPPAAACAHCRRTRNCSAAPSQLSTASPCARTQSISACCSSSSAGLASGWARSVRRPICWRFQRSVPFSSSHSTAVRCVTIAGSCAASASMSTGNANGIRASGLLWPCNRLGTMSQGVRDSASSRSSPPPDRWPAGSGRPASALGDTIGKRLRQQARRQINVDLPRTLRQAFGQLRGTLPPVRLRAAQPVADIHLPAARRSSSNAASNAAVAGPSALSAAPVTSIAASRGSHPSAAIWRPGW